MNKKKDIRILVIDDEFSIRESLADYFEDFEFQVETAASAEEALERVSESSFHVAIVDMRLPGLDGNGFIVRASRMDSRLQFIIHTGSVNYTVSPEVQKAGVTAEQVFLKPVYEMNQLVKMVESLVFPKDD